MNVNLRRDVDFYAAFYMPTLAQDSWQCNHYRVSMSLITNIDDFYEINIAMDRVQAMVESEFSDTIFVHDCHLTEIEKLQELGLNLTTLPEEPLDQVIGIMLYCKFNAIMEQRMTILQLDVASHRGGTVWYQHWADDPVGPFAEPGWWNCSSPRHSDLLCGDQGVTRIDGSSWSSYQLNWPDSGESHTPKVVYVDFRRDEN